MDVAILSGGPSLSDYRPTGATTVAINRAGCFTQPDWLCALDHPRHFSGLLVPNNGIATADCYVPDWQSQFQNSLVKGHDWVKIPPCIKRIANSSIYAMLFATQVLGGNRLHVWGVDMEGERIDRWIDEKQRWSALVSWMRKNGIEVIEYGKHRTP